jgi:hypothetical protein
MFARFARLWEWFGCRSWAVSRPAGPARRRPRIGVEALEDRQVPAWLVPGGGGLIYQAEVGVANNLQISYDAGRYTFSDIEPIAVLGAWDFDPDPFRAVIWGGGILGMTANLGDKNDTLIVRSVAHPLTVNAGTGDDLIHAGTGDTQLDGIDAPVVVHGEAGADALWLHDYGAFGPNHTYTVTHNLATRDGVPNIYYDTQVERLRLNAGWGHDTVNVWGTSPATAVTVSLKAGGWDVVNVGSPNYSLDTIQGPVDILGEVSPSTGLAVDSVSINDQADGNANTYTLTTEYFTRSDFPFPLVKGTIHRSGAAPITYWNGLAGLTLNAGRGNDVINVQGTAALAPLTVNAGLGNDTINVGVKGSVADILGPLHVNGQSGWDQIVIDDRANGPDIFVIDGVGRTVQRNNRILLTYEDVDPVTILD